MSQPRDPRIDDLLCDEALDGLDEAERRDLAALLGEQLDHEQLSFGRAAAAVSLAHTAPAPLPPALQQRILVAAEPFIIATPATPDAPVTPDATPTPSTPSDQPAPSTPSAQPAPPPVGQVVRLDRGRLAAWLIAAACLAAALVAIATRPPPPAPPQFVTVVMSVSVPVPAPTPPSPSDERARLLAAGPSAVRIAWANTKDPASQGVAGDVVWSNTEQRGYMSFRGLAPNDPTQSQYQLWIFDQNQDKRYPIDGGVFDVGPGGEVVVPITAKLQVKAPTLFAVTIEKPGGVVVSSRSRLVLAAPVPTG